MKKHKLLTKFPQDMVDLVFSGETPDIDYEFVGFVNVYAYLSKIIPRHWTIIDLGCAYAPQCWYFRKHKRYIGVDMYNGPRFFVENTKHVIMDIRDYCRMRLFEEFCEGVTVKPVFAICSYVSGKKEDLDFVHNYFQYSFTYYPQAKK